MRWSIDDSKANRQASVDGEKAHGDWDDARKGALPHDRLKCVILRRDIQLPVHLPQWIAGRIRCTLEGGGEDA